MAPKTLQVPFKIFAAQEVVSVFTQSLQRLRDKTPDLFLSNQTITDLKTAFTEAVANAIKHAQELKKRKVVTGRVYLNDRLMGFDVCDHGRGFRLDAVPVPDLYDLRASGRGVFMMKQLGDVVAYKKHPSKNVLSFKRYLVGQNANARELDLIYDLSEAMIRNASLNEVYALILDHCQELFHVERASILVTDEKTKTLKVAASRGIEKTVANKIQVRSGEGVSGYVFQHGRPLLIEDVTRNKRGIEQKKHYKTRSFISAPMICSPMRLDEKPVGVINLTDRYDGRQFTKKDLKLLSTIANQAMACLYVRDLVSEVKEAEGIKREMEQVRQIQLSYLPTTSPTIEGFDIAGRCEMAQHAGGDYFDYFWLPPYVYIVVADVSGHDTRSALTMVNLRSRLTAFLNFEKQPSRLLTLLNASLFQDLMRLEQFVSCLLIRVNTKTGAFVLANAGHYPPLFLKDHVPVTTSGLVLGVEEQEQYKDVSGELDVHDGMIFYTDGVIEGNTKSGGVYGMDRLQHFAEKNATSFSRVIVDGLIRDVTLARETKKQSDDVTVVVVKRENKSEIRNRPPKDGSASG